MNNFSLTEINEKISERSKFVADLKKNMGNVVSGQSELINKLIIINIKATLIYKYPKSIRTCEVKM